MASDLSIPGYDAWKTRAPEDERGYYEDQPEPEGNEDVAMCDGCGVEMGAGDCDDCKMACEEDLLEDYP